MGLKIFLKTWDSRSVSASAQSKKGNGKVILSMESERVANSFSNLSMGCTFKIGLSQAQLAIPRDVSPVNSLESISPIIRDVELVEDQQLALLDKPCSYTQAIEEKRAKKHKTVVELLGIQKTKNSKKGGRRNKTKMCCL